MIQEINQQIHDIQFWIHDKLDKELKQKLEQNLKNMLKDEQNHLDDKFINAICKYAFICYDTEEFLLYLYENNIGSQYQFFNQFKCTMNHKMSIKKDIIILKKDYRKMHYINNYLNKQLKNFKIDYIIKYLFNVKNFQINLNHNKVNQLKKDYKLQLLLKNYNQKIEVSNGIFIYHDENYNKDQFLKIDQLIKIFEYLQTKDCNLQKNDNNTKTFFSFLCDDQKSIYLLNYQRKKKIQQNMDIIKENCIKMAKNIRKRSLEFNQIFQTESQQKSKSLDLIQNNELIQNNNSIEYTFQKSNFITISKRKSNIFKPSICKQPKFTFTTNSLSQM